MIKNVIKSFLRRRGYTISKIEVYKNPFDDIKRLLGNKSSPIIFDVGANVGQSINQFLNVLPKVQFIHSNPDQILF